MTEEQIELVMPRIIDIDRGVLYVSKLKDVAHGVVHTYGKMVAGQILEIFVETSYSNFWSVQIVLVDPVETSITFLVPKDIFEKNFVPNNRAYSYYIVKDAGIEKKSEKLEFQVKE